MPFTFLGFLIVVKKADSYFRTILDYNTYIYYINPCHYCVYTKQVIGKELWSVLYSVYFEQDYKYRLHTPKKDINVQLPDS